MEDKKIVKLEDEQSEQIAGGVDPIFKPDVPIFKPDVPNFEPNIIEPYYPGTGIPEFKCPFCSKIIPGEKKFDEHVATCEFQPLTPFV